MPIMSFLCLIFLAFLLVILDNRVGDGNERLSPYRGALEQPITQQIKINEMNLFSIDLSYCLIKNYTYTCGKIQTANMLVHHRDGTGSIPLSVKKIF